MAQEVKEAAKKVEDYIISVPDFPKPGILFHDITGILNDADGLKLTQDTLYKALENENRNISTSRLCQSAKRASSRASIEVHKDAVRPGQKVVIIG